jgi:hypothetical protein
MKQYMVMVTATLPAHLDEELVRPELIHALRRYVGKMDAKSMHVMVVETGDTIRVVGPDGKVKA